MYSLLRQNLLLFTMVMSMIHLSCSGPSGSHPDKKEANGRQSLSSSDQTSVDSASITPPEKTNTKDDIPMDRLLGKFDPTTQADFVQIPEKYASRSGMWIRTEVWEAFLEMYKAAAGDGINLKILSATRNFEQQKTIWERKFGGKVSKMSMIPTREDQLQFAKEVLMFSSMPGTSRHHWGSDIDINSLEPEYFETPQGQKEYAWLKKNAPKFGFCQPYTNKANGRTGYEEEKWHWSYLPISVPYLNQYRAKVTYEMVCCFWGSDLAEELDVINSYVLGIEDTCKVLGQ